MQIARTITLGDEDAPEAEISVESHDDDENVFLTVTDYAIQGHSGENEPVQTVICMLSRSDALALARLINDAANDG